MCRLSLMLRKLIRLDSTLERRTVHEARNTYGAREWLEARERGFRMEECRHYETCLLNAAQARWDGWTCRCCRGSSGEWWFYIRRSGTIGRGKRSPDFCKVHGVPMVEAQQRNPNARRKPSKYCPVCRQDATSRKWQDESYAAKVREGNLRSWTPERLEREWPPDRRARQAERLAAMNRERARRAI